MSDKKSVSERGWYHGAKWAGYDRFCCAWCEFSTVHPDGQKTIEKHIQDMHPAAPPPAAPGSGLYDADGKLIS